MPGPFKWQHRMCGQVARWTLPRDVILGLLSQTDKHLSAKEIYGSLYKMYPGIGLTTVYRTLDLLARMGIVTRVSIGDGQNRYELKGDSKKDHHHHLICTRCGKIINYRDFVQEELDLVKKTEEALAERYNFAIKDHNIEFLGLCKNCQLKNL
jgi:Fur family ferric uptake transcriptional regulator